MSIQPLSPNQIQVAEQARIVWRFFLPADVDIEEALNDSFYAHVCDRLNLYDEIEVLAEDGRFYARLLVISKGLSAQDHVVRVQKIFYRMIRFYSCHNELSLILIVIKKHGGIIAIKTSM